MQPGLIFLSRPISHDQQYPTAPALYLDARYDIGLDSRARFCPCFHGGTETTNHMTIASLVVCLSMMWKPRENVSWLLGFEYRLSLASLASATKGRSGTATCLQQEPA